MESLTTSTDLGCLCVWFFELSGRFVSFLMFFCMTIGEPLPFRDRDVLILDTGLGSEEEQGKIKDLLHIEKPIIPDESGQWFWFLLL